MALNSMNWNDPAERFERICQDAPSKLDQVRQTLPQVAAEDAKLASQLVESPLKNLISEHETDGKLHLTEADIGKTFYVKRELRHEYAEDFYELRGFTEEHVYFLGTAMVDMPTFCCDFQRGNPDEPAQTQPEIKVGQVWNFRYTQTPAVVVRVNDNQVEFVYGHACYTQCELKDQWLETMQLISEPPLAMPKPTVNWRPIGEMKANIMVPVFCCIDFASKREVVAFNSLSVREAHVMGITHFAEIDMPEGPK